MTWAVCVAALFFHAVLASLSHGNTHQTSVVRALILDVLTPAEKLADRAGSAVAAVWSDYFALVGVREENQRLREALGSLQMEMAFNREAILEADRLRRYFELDPLVGSGRVVARVIGADNTYSSRTVTIDKGAAHGLRVDSAVMTPDGVVGRVIESARYSAVVQLISDPLSAVGVVAHSSRVQGVVRGRGGGALELEHFGDPAELAPGDLLVTSGTDRIYPKGLPVGFVASVGDPGDLTAIARIQPLADLGRLEEILGITEWPAAAPEEDEEAGEP